MIHDSSSDLRFAVDRLVTSGRRIFGWGWAADRTRQVTGVHLRVEGDSWQTRLHGGFGLSRQDVEETHPDLVNARTSGFVLTGFAPGEGARRIWLELDLADGTSDADIEEMCRKLLANTVIENFRIERLENA